MARHSEDAEPALVHSDLSSPSPRSSGSTHHGEKSVDRHDSGREHAASLLARLQAARRKYAAQQAALARLEARVRAAAVSDAADVACSADAAADADDDDDDDDDSPATRAEVEPPGNVDGRARSARRESRAGSRRSALPAGEAPRRDSGGKIAHGSASRPLALGLGRALPPGSLHALSAPSTLFPLHTRRHRGDGVRADPAATP